VDRLNDPRHIKWAKIVKARDDYTCQICDTTNTYLNSHHKNSWDMFENERFKVDNGVTLCVKCHERFHEIYGAGSNTECQFEEFARIAGMLRNIARANKGK